MKYEKLRYQSNKIAQLLMMLGMILMVIALFRVINVFRLEVRVPNKPSNISSTIWLGVEILIAIFVMLLSFLASERLKSYDKKWLPVGAALVVYPLVKIFLYPIRLNKIMRQMIADGIEIDYKPQSWLIITILLLVLSAVCYALSLYSAYVKIKQLDTYYEELNALWWIKMTIQ